MTQVFRVYSLICALFLLSFSTYAQEKKTDKVKITLNDNQSQEEFKEDQQECISYTDEQFDASGHKTAKNTGAGAVGGAVIGKIFGKPGAGAVIGGAGGAYRGRKKSSKDREEYNNIYASCLRDKGYSVEIAD